MAKSWQEAYQDFDSMTVPELRDLLKSKDLPVSGKKMDLIQYLIFEEYPDISQANDLRTLPSASASIWLNFQYELWLDTPEGFLTTGRSFDAINYQDIYSKVA
tara:strand:- start:19 stop:327 length:309 start_codon:yes stop_codon:yes gene_type:complete